MTYIPIFFEIGTSFLLTSNKSNTCLFTEISLESLKPLISPPYNLSL